VYSASFCDVFLWLQNHNVAFVVFGGEYHALRLYAHHRAVLKVEDESTFFAREVFGLVPLQEASDCCSFFGAEVDRHFDEVSGSCNVDGFDDFADAEVEFLEFIEWDVCAQVFTGCLFYEVCF
jgi:hypothetical protein